eukprot:6886354-Prymnesium_polylepis.2
MRAVPVARRVTRSFFSGRAAPPRALSHIALASHARAPPPPRSRRPGQTRAAQARAAAAARSCLQGSPFVCDRPRLAERAVRVLSN